MPQTTRIFDLEERTSRFAEKVIVLCRQLKQDPIIQNMVSQLLRSATSIGANYAEANGASSRKDFRNKIYLSKKESRETEYWLRILCVASPENKDDLGKLKHEAHEFVLIFQKITSSLKV